MKTITGRLLLNEDVASVLEFMERNIPADRLEYVATRIPALAKVMWCGEPCASLERLPTYALQPNASESAPADTCAGGDSVVAGGVPA